MSAPIENYNELKLCSFDVSFDLNEDIDIEKKGVERSRKISECHVECASKEVDKYVIQTEEINENVHDHEHFEVSFNISFKFNKTDLDPIPSEKDFFQTSSISRGISFFVE